MEDRTMTHRHCWHEMPGSRTDGLYALRAYFYACCHGGCHDVLAAGPTQHEERSHGPIREPGWPGTVHVEKP